MIRTDIVLKRAPGVIQAPLENALLFMNIDAGQYLMLEDTARDIWDAIDGERSVDHIVAILTAKYDVDEPVCRTEVLAFVEALLDQKMLEPPQ